MVCKRKLLDVCIFARYCNGVSIQTVSKTTFDGTETLHQVFHDGEGIYYCDEIEEV